MSLPLVVSLFFFPLSDSLHPSGFLFFFLPSLHSAFVTSSPVSRLHSSAMLTMWSTPTTQECRFKITDLRSCQSTTLLIIPNVFLFVFHFASRLGFPRCYTRWKNTEENNNNIYGLVGDSRKIYIYLEFIFSMSRRCLNFDAGTLVKKLFITKNVSSILSI